ncbi:MAG: tetratricopeptide repeat protein, partial [Flavobacteriales bacterium]|nr:tetratricopeptide repeat protein [Flavobacteriales bacterium]
MSTYRNLVLAVAMGLAPQVQAQYLDSLNAIWQDQTRPDSIRVAAYVDYVSDGYLDSQPDTAAILAEALHAFAAARQYPRASAKGYNLQGIVYHNQGDYRRALAFYQKCLAINERIGDQKGIAGNLNNIGLIYREQGNNLRALEYYQRSLAIFEVIGEKKGLGNTLNNIGNIYGSQRNYPRALEYYARSLAVREEMRDDRRIAASLNNFGVIYEEQGDTARALEYYRKSMAVSERTGDKNGMAASLNNIGVIYGNQRNYDRAVAFHQRSLAMREELGDKGGIAMSLNNIGHMYRAQGRPGLAIGFCQKSLALAEEIGALDLQKNACQCHYDTYKAMGKGNEALVYLEKMNGITDSLNAQEISKKLEQMEFAKVMLQDSIAKAEEARLVQQAHEDQMRDEERTRNIAIGGGIAVLLMAGGIYTRLRYVRRSKAALQVEKDRSENLLLNILPADIAAELKDKGRADARDFDQVSILFTDFKGFTAASEQLSAQELVSEINACFEAFDGIMGMYGIEKIKTIGDAYMAAGGLPVPTDGSAKNTLLAALDMQAFIAHRKAERSAKGLPFFEMRVGIH